VILLYLAGTALAVALVTSAFEAGAHRKFPEWTRFLSDVGWVLGGMGVGVIFVTLFFLAMGVWG
jgi:hypothetical protein